MPKEVHIATYRIDPDKWELFQEWCRQNKTDASKTIIAYIDSLIKPLDKHIDNNEVNYLKNEVKQLKAKIEQLDAVIASLVERLDKIEKQ